VMGVVSEAAASNAAGAQSSRRRANMNL